jgi:hypothetical protein
VARRRGRGHQERLPVVVEIHEDRRDVDRLDLDTAESGPLERIPQGPRLADLEPQALGRVRDRRVLLDGGVPEVPHDLHPVAVVPDVDRDGATRARHAPHLGKHRDGVGDEVQDQTGDGRIDRVLGQR